jgi:DNA-binding SARP family transcriptional activator
MNPPDKVYNEILEHVLRLLSEHHPIEMVAAALMAIAQRLYKTHLSEENYERIMKVAIETKVEPYDIKKGTLH